MQQRGPSRLEAFGGLSNLMWSGRRCTLIENDVQSSLGDTSYLSKHVFGPDCETKTCGERIVRRLRTQRVRQIPHLQVICGTAVHGQEKVPGFERSCFSLTVARTFLTKAACA